ncbi:MAG: DUF4360 domain-containing protein [Thiothrix sp.]|nr:DUF4360 domain-containing protein [Thiothrix sp.]HPE59650.1 DUF4360 domain-containing protein [Thiolinea sp.]
MKALATVFAATLAGLALNAPVSAADSVYFKSPVNFAGTGCPAGSIAVTGANTDTLSILFDQYDAGNNAMTGLNRSACSFAVPVHVPQGMQVSVMTADWQGFAQGRTQLSRKYFFAGAPNQPWLRNDYNAPNGKDFLERDGLMHSSSTWAPCGQDIQLRINSNIRSIGGGSYMAVDTVDLKNKVVFQLQWRGCR